MRAMIIEAALLLSGCYSAFALPECMERCEACAIVDCEPLCERIEAATTSEECHAEGTEHWLCIQRIGCDFPLQCRPTRAALVECEVP